MNRPPLPELRADRSFTTRLAGRELTFSTTWGLFSPRSIDEGTALLAHYLEVPTNADCLDLGCGYGPLGLTLAALAPQGTTQMIDKDFVAVDYANRNAQANSLLNARAYLSNGYDAVDPSARFDVIATNMPAKIGAEQLQIFLADSWYHLKPGGSFYIVTVSGLKDFMKRHLTETFGHYEKLKQSPHYTAARSIKAA